MVFAAADNRNPQSLASRMRRQRTALFAQLLDPFPEPVRVLDIGGTPSFWLHKAPTLPKRCDFTLLNLAAASTDGLAHARCVAGDARRMAFADLDFDVAFSNSVIEHVCALYDQLAMAREVRRVARAYFVQTPNRYFPLEPHFLFPLWQFLPLWFRAALHRRAQLGWMQRQPDALLARADVEQVRLLDYREMAWLFPNATIRRETLGPLTKSLVAIQGAQRRPDSDLRATTGGT